MGWFNLVVSLLSYLLLVQKGTANEGDLVCPQGVESFSTGPQRQEYYYCEKSNTEAVLTNCPAGTKYWPRKESCLSIQSGKNNSSVDLVTHTRDTLGENVFIGDAFDANKVEFYPLYSFWKRQNILEHTIRTASPLVKVQVYRTKSMTDRLEKMDSGLSLATDIASGLVRVAGSSLYLKVPVISNQEAAVVLSYEVTTHTDTFPIQTLRDQDICLTEGPTHVVSAATYGLGGNFVFKKMVAENESMDESFKKLEDAVNAITTRSTLSPSLQKFVKNVRVSFFGDFIPGKEPASFQDSVDMYESLPSYSNKTVKVRVELMPITEMCFEKKVAHITISQNLLNSVNIMLTELERTGININSLINDAVVQKYLPILKIMQRLKKEVTILDLKIKSELRAIIPQIRSGIVGEDKLVALLNSYQDSPLSSDNIEEFLENRGREAAMLKYVLSARQFSRGNMKIVSYKDAIDMRTMFKKRFMVMLRFNILTPKNLVEKFLNRESIDESSSWFNSPVLISEMGTQFDKFSDFALANVKSKRQGYILGIRDANKKTIECNAQKAGLFYSFKIPDTPELLQPVGTSHHSVRFVVIRPNDTWITGVRISYSSPDHSANITSMIHKFTHDGPCNITINHLTPYDRYQYTMQHFTPMGVSEASAAGEFITRPCSPPSNPRLTDVEAHGFTLFWNRPAVCGRGARVTGYSVIITTNTDKFSRTITVRNGSSIAVEHLNAAQVYTVQVKAGFANSNVNWTFAQETIESLPATVSVLTLPSCPSSLQMVTRSTHSVSVSWSRGSVPIGSIVYGYRVRYQIVNNIGNVSQEGTMMSKFVKETSCELTALVEGTSYDISVKVVTSMGASAYSPSIIAQTKFNETELELLRKKLIKDQIELKEHIRNESNILLAKIQAESNKTMEKIQRESSELKGRIQNESKQIMATMDNETTVLRESLSNFEHASEEQLKLTKKKIEGQITAILGRVSNLETDQDISRLKFLGYGWYGSYSEEKWTNNLTFEQCLAHCINYTRSNGKDWNGIQYAIRRDKTPCGCIRNDKGHTESTDSLHFRYM